MKNSKLKLMTMVFSILLFSACKDVIYENDLRNVPVYLTYKELRSAIVKAAPQELENPGKIYFKDGYIFINEELKGIHIIDNRDPHHPTNTAFIEIPGNMDMAIKNNILYADSYIDLVSIDISDLNAPKEVDRVSNIFPYAVPKLKDRNFLMANVDEEKGVVIDWEIDYARIQVERRSYPIYPNRWYRDEYLKFDGLYGNLTSSSASSQSIGGYTSTSTGGQSFGIGGSMARFGLNGDMLYTVDSKMMHIFNVANGGEIILKNKQEAGQDIETLFIHDGHMFLGTMSGMLVYSLSEPENPLKIHSYRHVTSCDPVVVQNHIAYITLRGGNECGNSVSKLDILSLGQDYKTSKLLHSYTMYEPYGLGIDDEILFVCDGRDGLLIYEASDLAMLMQNKIAQFPDIDAYDVIPFNDYLFMIGKDGFYQYDYSNLQNIEQVSFIEVKKK